MRPDAGTVRIDGRPVRLPGPPAAHALGVWTVFQELTLLPGMSVAENLLLAREPRGRWGLIDRGRMAARAEEVLAGQGVYHIDPRALVEDIPLAERQVVEIARAVSHDPRILLLDEPTSSLVEREVAWLFGQIARLRADGTCHRLHLPPLERDPRHRRPLSRSSAAGKRRRQLHRACPKTKP